MKRKTILLLFLLLTIIGYSQSWKANADSLIVNHLFVDAIGSVDIYAFPEMLTSSDTILLADGSIIQIPYSNCYGYFIDLLPTANWAHPCNYCFVNASLNQTMVSAKMPPKNDDLISLSLYSRSIPNPQSVVFDTTFVRDCRTMDNSHKWAVLICADNSEHRYWFDLSSVYTVLTNVYGFQEAEYLEETTPRHIIVSAPKSISQLYMYGLNNLGCGDLNGNNSFVGDFFDYQNEPITQYNKENLESIFKCFAGDNECIEKYAHYELRELHEDDQLFIYITGHGDRDNLGTYFTIEKQTGGTAKIYDFDLVNMLHDIKCSQMTLIMQNCHSGGFIEKFMDDIYEPDCLCKNRVGQSAANAEGFSRKEIYGVYIESRDNSGNSLANEFTYYWTSAALGYYPYYRTNDNLTVEKGPWDANNRIVGSGNMNWSDYFGNYEYTLSHEDYDINPDTDSDGVLSLNELFEFANNLDTWSRQGYYYPNHNDTSDFNFPPQYVPEFPQQHYESSFTKEAATLVGYESQMDGILNSGTAMQPYRLCGDVWVSSDSELTMWDEVQSPENVRIYIKPSGKLILDGAMLTNLPEEQSPMWEGVQVWGNRSKHQSVESGRYWQGFLEMKNEAAIQNAIIGIDVWNPDDDESTGGIVKAINSHFINNTTSVFFHPYENQFENYYHPGEIVINNNVSFFKNCIFSIDDKHIGPGEFEMHVYLFRVRGVSFNGCHFNYNNNRYSSPWPMGIYAWDAGFKVGGTCTSGYYSSHCQALDNSTFDGFYKAVVSLNDGSVGVRPITIMNTDFTNNGFGVFALRSGFPLVLNSSFSIGQDSTQCAVGVFVEYTPNFTIEQDTFCVAPKHPIENYGIIIKDSKSQNQIYKNVFNGLHCANLSIGQNNTWMMPRNITDAKAIILGLEYRCNENEDNWCDFYVHGGNRVHMAGIQNNQGTGCVPANNLFSQGSVFQFENHGDYVINYYYDSSYYNVIPTYASSVTTERTKDTIFCPSHYSLFGNSYNDTLTPILSNGQKLQKETDYYKAYTAYNSIKSIYDNMINGGDTEGEIMDIRTATPSDMWTLRAQLLGHSPYLSNEVLVSMIDRDDVFPQSVLFEILSANPDELKNDTLFSNLESMPTPMPDYMIGLLHQLANGVTARTAMESQLARYSQEYRQAATDIIRSILCDTVVDKVSLIGWLGNMNDLESDREIVSIYLEDGNYTDAVALASMFPTLYALSGDDLSEHNEYMTLLNLYGQLKTNGRNTMQLDSIERATIEQIADYGLGTPQAMAKAIMMGAYGYSYDDCPSGLNLSIPTRGLDYSDFSLSNEDFNSAMGFSVNMSPNPASTWVTIDYSLPLSATKAQMRIFNALGLAVATCDLYTKETQKVLDLRGLASGVYTYVVYCGKNIQTGKLIVVK